MKASKKVVGILIDYNEKNLFRISYGGAVTIFVRDFLCDIGIKDLPFRALTSIYWDQINNSLLK